MVNKSQDNQGQTFSDILILEMIHWGSENLETNSIITI